MRHEEALQVASQPQDFRLTGRTPGLGASRQETENYTGRSARQHCSPDSAFRLPQGRHRGGVFLGDRYALHCGTESDRAK